MYPTKSMPAPATFAMTENSSLEGFLVSLSTRIYSPNLKGILPGISLFSNNIFHVHNLDKHNDLYKSYLKIIAVLNEILYKNSFWSEFIHLFSILFSKPF